MGWGGGDLISQVSLVLKCRLHFQMLPGSFLPSKNTQRVSLKWLVLNDDETFGPFRSPNCKNFGVIGVSQCEFLVQRRPWRCWSISACFKSFLSKENNSLLKNEAHFGKKKPKSAMRVMHIWAHARTDMQEGHSWIGYKISWGSAVGIIKIGPTLPSNLLETDFP